MRWGRREQPLLSVVVPAYDVAAYLPACLDSILASTHTRLQVVVVDDGSPDESGAIAEAYAARDPRVIAVHTDNRGLGAARNEGLRHVTGDLLAFADSDDVVPPGAYDVLHRQLRRSGADLVTGSIARWETTADGTEQLVEPPWMRRLHRERRSAIIDQHPEILGDVFAWNKLFRTSFWRDNQLGWPEGVRYEDQPTITEAFLRARLFGVIPDVVYHWRIRTDGSSITQQRSSIADLRDRLVTKQLALASVEDYGSTEVTRIFRDRVLAGDLHRYFIEIPGCTDEWWDALRIGVLTMYAGRSLTHSGLPPVHRLCGFLVEQGRRAEADALMSYIVGGGIVGRVVNDRGARIDVAVVDPRSVPIAALELRGHEL